MRGTRVVALILVLQVGCAVEEPLPLEPERPRGPLTIDSALALALRNNPDVQVAEHRLDQARSAIDEAYSYYWPALQLVERFTQTNVPSQAFGSILDQRRFDNTLDFNDPGVTRNFRTGLTGSITLYDGGRRRSRTQEASARAGAIAARRQIVRRDLALEIARSFHLVHEARELDAAQQESLKTLETHLRVTRARVAEGAARKSEELSVEVRLAETREAAIAAGNSGVRAEAGLLILLGLGVEEPVVIEKPPLEDLGPPGARRST